MALHESILKPRDMLIQASLEKDGLGQMAPEQLHHALDRWLAGDPKRGNVFQIRVVSYELDGDGKTQVIFE